LGKEIIEVPVLSEAVRRLGLPFSLVTRANGFVFVSGTPPLDIVTGKFVAGDIEAQAQGRRLVARARADDADLCEQRRPL
jgi:enamine deaminase RidA (YjgF/YER057c/UK114 family)